MIEEELKKEAEEHCNEVMCTVCENKTCTERKIKCREWRDRCAGYYCGAAPRERRIADLEQTNKDLADCNSRLLSQAAAATKRVIQLETENNKLLDVINNQDIKIADSEKQIEKMKNCWNCENWNWKHGK